MNEYRRNDLTVEVIGALRTGYDRSIGDALVMPQKVLHKKRLTGFTLTNEHHDLVVLDFGHVEFLQTEIQATGRNSSSTYGCC